MSLGTVSQLLPVPQQVTMLPCSALHTLLEPMHALCCPKLTEGQAGTSIVLHIETLSPAMVVACACVLL